MHTLTVYRGRDVWLVRSTNPAVRRLFHTDTLPTPWPPTSSPAFVRARLAELNPDARIVMATGVRGELPALVVV